MSSSYSQNRVIHQDYIARIRYSNALPPPPNPPKLLDIPNTGLASGQYTNPGFASRLARDQPLNIEADAELGMPLDMVGLPGVFDGDESYIQAPLNNPVPHPQDRALLRPLSTLGKPKLSESGVSFLRRTEYISSYTSKSRFESTTSRSLVNSTAIRKSNRPAQNLNKESPEYIQNQVEKTFETATHNLKNPSLIRHPSKRSLKLVDCYPVLPDLDSFPDAGGYVSIKFLTNPVPPSSTYDKRLESSLLKPIEPSEEFEAQKQIARDLHERDPERYPAPEERFEYEFFLTETVSESLQFKRKFDPQNPSNKDESLYPQKTLDGKGCFRFKRVRAYESSTQSGDTSTKYDDEVVIAIQDGTDGLNAKGAYYYPIVQKTSIRPRRTKNIDTKKWNTVGGQDELRRQTDFVDLIIEEPDEEMQRARDVFRTMPYGPEENIGDQQDAKEQSPSDD
ncbi:BgTH12-07913 [Blumeria graminis f. sp. triticale]|uniref:Bgt-3812 n=3 Tax=Blumeria graminis TaxID=34373 RepID=A0A381L955_BLUGR|nr:RNAP II-associated protein [Blumeria graminis f. sp. tritici 96224]CAD6501784.1 BgTH12-07913 [Blumeria graminis f. sp. triticale]VDB84431.1 Bgt-3812 [Blumeria graminis f. sp. tritici]